MTDEPQDQPEEIQFGPDDRLVEGGSAPEWVALGLSAGSLALNTYNTFRPGQNPPPTQEPQEPQAPKIELPPGVDLDDSN